jgi:hypothetical protein
MDKNINIYHIDWKDNLYLDYENHIIKRSYNDDTGKFILIDNFLLIIWEKWGKEYFYSKDNDNDNYYFINDNNTFNLDYDISIIFIIDSTISNKYMETLNSVNDVVANIPDASTFDTQEIDSSQHNILYRLIFNRTLVYWVSLILTGAVAGIYLYFTYSYYQLQSILTKPEYASNPEIKKFSSKLPSIIWLLIIGGIFLLLFLYLVRNRVRVFTRHVLYFFLNIYIIVFIIFVTMYSLYSSAFSKYSNTGANATISTTDYNNIKSYHSLQSKLLLYAGIGSIFLWIFISVTMWIMQFYQSYVSVSASFPVS